MKLSVGVARGQALAVNGPECWREDCDKPVAQLKKLSGGIWVSLADTTVRRTGLLACLLGLLCPTPPLSATLLSQVETQVAPDAQSGALKATADAFARGSLLSATRVRRRCAACQLE